MNVENECKTIGSAATNNNLRIHLGWWLYSWCTGLIMIKVWRTMKLILQEEEIEKKPLIFFPVQKNVTFWFQNLN